MIDAAVPEPNTTTSNLSDISHPRCDQPCCSTMTYQRSV
jgi:hypothetical protein